MIVMEVRGRGHKWRVYYPNEMKLGSPVEVYDRDGVLKEVVWCGSAGDGMTEAHFVGTQEEAEAYARYLGAGEVKTIRTSTKAQNLAKARAAAQRAREEAAA